MTTWTLGSEAEGLVIKITAVQDGDNVVFTVTVEYGTANVNAVYWGDGEADGAGAVLAGDDITGKISSSLNMNGTGVDWDSYYALSNPGLKGTVAADEYTFTLTNTDLAELDINDIGVRATSTSTAEGSIKWHTDTPDAGNTAPVAVDDTLSVTEAQVETASSVAKVLVGNVLTQGTDDSDVDGDSLSVSAVTTPLITETDAGLTIVSITAVTADPGEVARFQITTNFGDAFLSVESDGDVQMWADSGEDPFRALGVSESADINFSYTVSDGNGGTDTADVTLTVSGTNDAPVAVDDTLSVTEAQVETASSVAKVLVGNVLTQGTDDSDVDGDSLSVSAVTTPLITETDAGLTIVSITAVTADPGEVARFQITTNFGDAFLSVESDGDVQMWADSGEDPFRALGVSESADINFSYTVSDGNGGTDTADVTLTVSGTNDAPVAVDDKWILSNATTATLSSNAVLLNDSDVDGDGLTIQSVSATSTLGRSLTLNPDGSITYTNASTLLTQDTFQYTASDGNGGTSIKTVTIDFVTTNDSNQIGANAINLSTVAYDASYIDGKVGNDALIGTTLSGSAGLDTLVGGDGADQLTGNGGDDVLLGGGGNDNLMSGGAGNDILVGGDGNDILTGGADADTFVYKAGDQGDGGERITDFSTTEDDNLDISDLIDSLGLGGLSLDDLVNGGHLIVTNTAVGGVGTGAVDTVIQIDANGPGAPAPVHLVTLVDVTFTTIGSDANHWVI